METKPLEDKSASQKITPDSNIEDLAIFKEAKELFNQALDKIYPSQFSVKSVYKDLVKLASDE